MNAPASDGSYRYLSTSEAGTDRLGAALARVLEPGMTIALCGTLGAGKTRLVRSVAQAAGVDARQVSSPTFVLVHEYVGTWPIYHFDVYRLEDLQQFLDLGAAEYLASEGVCFIEWADRVSGALPDDSVRVEIAPTHETGREFCFRGNGPRSDQIVTRLARELEHDLQP